MWRRPLFLFLLSAAFAIPALALDRPFPADTKRGKMTPAPYPKIEIGGKMRYLAAGARIRNTHNLIQMPASLRGSDIVVNYTENAQGEIEQVWILTPEEAAESIEQQTNSQSR